MALLLMISSMPPGSDCPCAVTLPKLATTSGLGSVRSCKVPEMVVVASPVVCTLTVAANEVTLPAFCPARVMACVAESDAAEGDAEGLPDALAAGVPVDDDEQPASASAAAVMAMAPHCAWANRENTVTSR